MKHHVRVYLLLESEKEANGGYSDLYIKENVLYKEYINYRFVLEFKHIKRTELKGDFNSLSKEELLALNKEFIDARKKEAQEQLEQYIEDHNIIFDSEKELKKIIVITIARKYVLYYNLTT